MGARHFAERAQRVQNLQQLWMLKSQDPTVGAHMSGRTFAKIMAEELNEPELFGDNVSVFETLETQEVAREAQLVNDERNQIGLERGI